VYKTFDILNHIFILLRSTFPFVSHQNRKTTITSELLGVGLTPQMRGNIMWNIN